MKSWISGSRSNHPRLNKDLETTTGPFTPQSELTKSKRARRIARIHSLRTFRIKSRKSICEFITPTGNHAIPDVGTRVRTYLAAHDASWQVIYPNGFQPVLGDDELNDADSVARLKAEGFTFLLPLEVWVAGALITLLAVAITRAHDAGPLRQSSENEKIATCGLSMGVKPRQTKLSMKNIGLAALVAASQIADHIPSNSVSNRISPNKSPSTRQKLASRRRSIRSPGYRDQHRRDSGCAANQVSGSSAATAGGVVA